MAKYEQINAGTDKAQHALTVSAFTQFAIALFVVAVAAGGAFINFKLIALPMSEMVGAGDYITSALRTSEVAALVIIFVEASMGLFLLEAMRVTHLFPRIASLDEVLRRRMLWIAFTLLVTLAGVEAALALMRDMLIADKQALVQSLATVQALPNDGWLGRIPTAGQMLLGFMLVGCGDSRSHRQAVYMLVDTSGTYAQEAGKAVLIINYLLGTLQPGDSLAVARVQSRSFSEKDIVAKATFDARPSQANAQKRAFHDKISAAFRNVTGSRYTDITGGLIQAAEFLNEGGAGAKTIIIFSDMQEELDKVTVRS